MDGLQATKKQECVNIKGPVCNILRFLHDIAMSSD